MSIQTDLDIGKEYAFTVRIRRVRSHREENRSSERYRAPKKRDTGHQGQEIQDKSRKSNRNKRYRSLDTQDTELYTRYIGLWIQQTQGFGYRKYTGRALDARDAGL